MPDSRPAFQLVHGEPVQARPTRVLLGWLTAAEVSQALIGRAPENEQDAKKAADQLGAARKIVQARPRLEPQDPIVPPDAATSARLKQVALRPDIQTAFATMKWRPEMVDLRKVLSFQKLVAIDSLEERVAPAKSADGLWELCLPSTVVSPPQGVIADADGKGFTVSALNPNLRHAGSHVSSAMVAPAEGLPPVPMQAITLFVNMGASFLQIVKYKDRCFVRDGYHRAAGLLRAGIHIAPAIYIEAQSFEDISCPAGSLTYEVMYGDRPPLLSDFWNDEVSRAGQQIAVRKVLRVRIEEFIVPR